jgi:hypothetical protein
MNSENPFKETGIDPNIISNIHFDRIPKVLGLYQKALSLGLHPDTGANSASTEILVGINTAIEKIETSPNELVQTWLNSINVAEKSKKLTAEVQHETYEPSAFFEKYTRAMDGNHNFWTPATYVIADSFKSDSLSIVEFDGKNTTIQKSISIGGPTQGSNIQSIRESIEFGEDCQPLLEALYSTNDFSLINGPLASRSGLLVVRDNGENYLQSRKNDVRIDNPIGDDPDLSREFKTGVYSLFSTPKEAILKRGKYTADEVSGPTFDIINISVRGTGSKVEIGEKIIGFAPTKVSDQITESLKGRYDRSPFSNSMAISGTGKRQITNSLNFDDPLSVWMLEQEIQPEFSRSNINRMDKREKLHIVFAREGAINITGAVVACIPL